MTSTDYSGIDPRADERVETLHALEILDTPPEREFDLVAQLAAELLGCPIAMVSLLDTQRQWFKARYGLNISETPLEESFCRVPVQLNRPLIVSDAQADPRFRDHALVREDPNVRFYAGVPLRIATSADRDAVPIGTLCAVDNQPREATPQDLRVLETLGLVLETMMAARLAEARARLVAVQLGNSLAETSRLHRQLEQAERLARIGSWRITLDDKHFEWSPQLYEIFELAPGSVVMVDDALAFFPPQDRASLTAAVEQTIATGRAFDIEVSIVTGTMKERRLRSLGEMELQNGEPVAVFGVFNDITDRHELEVALREAADVDELTRLGSRKRCNAHLDQTIARCLEDGSPLALVLIDLDHFKAVNDRCGHAAGDEVLRRAGQALRAPWLAGSFAGRLGGDEFVLLVTEPELLADLPGTIRRLLTTLRQDVECPGSKGVIPVSGTLGAAWLAPDCADRATLMSRADQALYRAKNAIRGTAAIAGEDGALTAD